MKIAIVKLSALGDIVHAMVALQFIKAHSPDMQIDWIVEERFAEVLKNNPDIDHILTVNLKSLKTNKTGIFQQIKAVRGYAQNHYDLVIDAQGLIKSAVIDESLSLVQLAEQGIIDNAFCEYVANTTFNIRVLNQHNFCH